MEEIPNPDRAVVIIGTHIPIDELEGLPEENRRYMGPDATAVWVPREVFLPILNDVVARAEAEAEAATSEEKL